MFFVLYSHLSEFGLATRKDFSLEEAKKYQSSVHADYNAFIATSDLNEDEEGDFFIIYHHFGDRVLIPNQSFKSKDQALSYAANIESNLEAFVIKKL